MSLATIYRDMLGGEWIAIEKVAVAGKVVQLACGCIAAFDDAVVTRIRHFPGVPVFEMRRLIICGKQGSACQLTFNRRDEYYIMWAQMCKEPDDPLAAALANLK